MALEESVHFVVVVKFTTLVKVDVLTGDLGSMLLQPVVKPVLGCTFGDSRCTIKSNQDIAGFFVETTIGGSLSLVFGTLTGKSEVDGQA
jgi:hypothetical protein